MNTTTFTRNRILAIAAAIAVILLIVSIATHKSNGIDRLLSTDIVGTYAGATDSILPDYVGQTNTNLDAVLQSFVIFNRDHLSGIPSNLTPKLPLILQTALSRQLPPSSGSTYIQIVPSSVSCASEFNCSFDFYIDSPEAYFHFHLTYDNQGTQYYSLKREAIPGAQS